MEKRSTLVFVDLEMGDEYVDSPIIELAAVAVESGTYREIEAFDCLIQFDVSRCTPKYLGTTKFSPHTWDKWAIPEEDAAAKLAYFLRKNGSLIRRTDEGEPYRVAQLASHNGSFDGDRLFSWFERLGKKLPASPAVLCTIQKARWFIEAHQELSPPYDFRLGTLAYYFSLNTEPTHRALADTRTAIELARAIDFYGRPRVTRAA